MEYYKTISDFSSYSHVQAFFFSIASAVPGFFSILVFILWVLGSGASYFVILKTTGKKRFFHTTTAMSFVMVIVSVLLTSMNVPGVVQVMSGYWVGFYILATILCWYGLTQYK